MIFTETNVNGVYVIELEKIGDERGFFARAWCEHEFGQHGLNTNIVQCNSSFCKSKGTLRGLHYQRKPHEEVKVIRCFRGAIFDVALDIRETSPTFRQWTAVELTEQNRKMLYVPEGCAHGYISLTDNTEIYYLVSEFYHPESEGGVRWDDPAFGIDWPVRPTVLSDKDRNHPYWDIETQQ